MLHLDVFSRASDDACTIQHVAAPPMFIADQSAECVMDAVQNRFGGVVWAAGDDSLRVLILNSDSHSALVRLAKHFGRQAQLAGPAAKVLSVHSTCQMHKFFACLARMVKGFELINGMFCSTLLLHKGPTMRKLQKGSKGGHQESPSLLLCTTP